MAFSFDIDLDEKVDMREKLKNVQKMAHESPYNVALQGDENGGEITGIIAGNYTVGGSKLTITIKKKPIVLSQQKIKQALTGFFV